MRPHNTGDNLSAFAILNTLNLSGVLIDDQSITLIANAEVQIDSAKGLITLTDTSVTNSIESELLSQSGSFLIFEKGMNVIEFNNQNVPIDVDIEWANNYYY